MCIVAPTFLPSKLMYSKESFLNFESMRESSLVEECEGEGILSFLLSHGSLISQFSQI